MAIVQTAGTEIIRSIMYDNLDNSPTGELVLGAQHHIYTILSIIVYCHTASSTVSENRWTATITGVSGRGCATASEMTVFKTPILVAGQTYVWNDKFSFNGFEPLQSSLSGEYNTVAEQTAVAAQAHASAQQYFTMVGGGSTAKADIFCTFIDQNNA